MPSPIVAILNCYSPANGATVAHVLSLANGDVQIRGEESLARASIRQLLNARVAAGPLPPDLLMRVEMAAAEPMPAAPACAPMKPPRRRICRACRHANAPGSDRCTGCNELLPKLGRPKPVLAP